MTLSCDGIHGAQLRQPLSQEIVLSPGSVTRLDLVMPMPHTPDSHHPRRKPTPPTPKGTLASPLFPPSSPLHLLPPRAPQGRNLPSDHRLTPRDRAGGEMLAQRSGCFRGGGKGERRSLYLPWTPEEEGRGRGLFTIHGEGRWLGAERRDAQNPSSQRHLFPISISTMEKGAWG